MHFDTYQELARETRLPTANRIYTLLNLSGEVGELHSYLAKQIRDGYEIDEDNVCKELGDILWHVAAIADDFGISLSKVADGNIAKLTSRQQRGKLSGNGDNR